MNEREQLRAILSFKKPDRLPVWQLEGITEGAVRQWCVEYAELVRNFVVI